MKMRSLTHLGWAVAVTLMLAYACSNEKNTQETVTGNTADSIAKIIPVRIVPIQVQNITRTLDYTANLTAFKEINFAPASPGRINKIHVEIGNRIVRGQLLVEMDKTQLNQAATQYTTAKSTFERVDTLYQLGSISEQQHEQTKTQYEVAKASYDFLTENTSLVSPLNGIVTGKYFENGELYSGVPNTAAGKAAVLTLMQINPLKAIVSISQSFFPNLKEGMKTEITTDIFPGKVFKGSVYKVYPTIDVASRTFKTEILVENPGEILRPGMFGDIKIKLEDAQVLAVPSIAVLKQEGTNNRYVFLHENGIAKQVTVTLGKRFDDQIEIAGDGIVAGAELIIDGQSNLLNGSQVNLVKD